MKIIRYFFYLTFFAICGSCATSHPYGIRPADNARRQSKKDTFLKRKNKVPPAYQSSVSIKEGRVVLELQSVGYLKKLFKHRRDGVAIDLIPRSHFPCGEANKAPTNWAFRGVSMPPVYKKEILEGLKANKSKSKRAEIDCGPLPEGFDPEKWEANALFIGRRVLASYDRFGAGSVSASELLRLEAPEEPFEWRAPTFWNHVELSFKLFFEKGKTELDESYPEELRQLLLEKKYAIEKAYITSYASVEGTLSQNAQVYSARALAVKTKLLQDYGQDFETLIKAKENWRAFEKLVGSHPAFSRFKGMSQREVKRRLQDDALRAGYDEFLEKHRYVHVKVKLKKEIPMAGLGLEELLDGFEKAVRKKRSGKDLALEYQNELIHRVKDGRLSADRLLAVKIPEDNSLKELRYHALWLKSTEASTSSEQLDALDKLVALSPENTANLFRWAVLAQKTEGAKSLKKLRGRTALLAKRGVRTERLEANNLLLELASKKQRGNYKADQRAFDRLQALMEQGEFRLNERILVAKYALANRHAALCAEFLKDVIYIDGVGEEPLFMYLEATISSASQFESETLRKLAARALRLNPHRFCRFFNSYFADGHSFQLLENRLLKDIHCEECKFFSPAL